MDLRDFLLPTAMHNLNILDFLVPDAGILSDGLMLPFYPDQILFTFFYFLRKYPFFVTFLLDQLLFDVGRLLLHADMTFHDRRLIWVKTGAKRILLLTR